MKNSPADKQTTREPQYQQVLDIAAERGVSSLGLMTNEAWNLDPRRLLFTLARYKFAAKMLAGKERVLEIGCADAFGTRLVQQETAHVTAVDFDPVFIRDVQGRMDPRWPIDCRVHDMVAGPLQGNFDAAYCLDVFEHIAPEHERRFIGNILASLDSQGVLLIGMPSLESQAHASPQSRAGHVNCKTGADLRSLMREFFHNVFLFSMNDEVVHTGFAPMAHYLFVLCCGVRK